jgi:hypothetical protein
MQSQICRFVDFSQEWYRTQEKALRIRDIYSWHSAAKQEFTNRKFWEWCAIAQALEERGRLVVGTRGLGFAVGSEPLSSYFASHRCPVLATDLDAASSNEEWIKTNQHAVSLDALYFPQLVDRTQFEQCVKFQPADMRTLDGLRPGYDFLWSSCAMEHLGTLDAGLEFVCNSAALLNPGGIAVHTTEFNISSEEKTVEVGDSVLYRRRDIIKLAAMLEERGCRLSPVAWDVGNHPFDLDYDRAPYMESHRRHIKLMIDGFVSTSMLLIVERRS